MYVFYRSQRFSCEEIEMATKRCVRQAPEQIVRRLQEVDTILIPERMVNLFSRLLQYSLITLHTTVQKSADR